MAALTSYPHRKKLGDVETDSLVTRIILLNREGEKLQGLLVSLITHVLRFNSMKGAMRYTTVGC